MASLRLRHVLSLFPVLLLLLLMRTAAFAESALVQENGVPVYTGPGAFYACFAKLDKGLTVEVTNRSNPGWYQISWDGYTGFVSSTSLQMIPEAPAATEYDTPDPYGGVPIPGTMTTGNAESFSQPVLGTPAENPLHSIGVSLPEEDTVPAGSSSSGAVSSSTQDGVTVEFGLAPSPAGGSTASTANTAASSEKEFPVAGTVIGNAVRMRNGPGTTYSIAETFNRGTNVLVTGRSGVWMQVAVNNQNGYIHEDYIELSSPADTASAVLQNAGAEEVSSSANMTLPVVPSAPASHASQFTPQDGYISGNSIRLRSAPSMTADILTELNQGTALRITGREDGWVKVICNGREGFVWSEYVVEGTYQPKDSVNRAKGASLGKEIAAYALNYLGSPYKWGGNSPAVGFDCSGFVNYVFSQFGYTTSRVANDVTQDGIHVDPKDMQPGDVLCFYSGNGYVGHVGIYIGDDTFVHAANSSAGVVTTPLSDGYYASRGYEVRRIIE